MWLALLPLASFAAPDGYAVVVGSNRAGPGQTPLAYATADAERVRDALVDVGGYDEARVDVLVDPSVADLRGALDRARAAADADGVLLFYYSGHARAQALDLGDEQLAIDALRAELDAMPAKVKVVVLDACQAGVASTAKGAAAAPDFSYNSVAGLRTEGMAVLASSTATELSQESPILGGSYFTHHLVTGLRGAADADGDGRVALTEAYDYAYDRTTVGTASTALGTQHPTLETSLRGHGDLVLTEPATADARLAFGPEVEGEILLRHDASGAVVAEVVKAVGQRFELALPAGQYTAIVRAGGRSSECRVSLVAGGAVPFDEGTCAELRRERVVAKGGYRSRLETVMVEGSLGGMVDSDRQFVDALEARELEPGIDFLFGRAPIDVVFTGSVVVGLSRQLGVVATLGNLDNGDTARSEDLHSVEWFVYRTGVGPRLQRPLWGDRLVPYAQAQVGPAMGQLFQDYEAPLLTRTWGPAIAAGGGVQLHPDLYDHRDWGLFAQAEYVWAPVLEDLDGERRNGGGLTLQLGLRLGS